MLFFGEAELSQSFRSFGRRFSLQKIKLKQGFWLYHFDSSINNISSPTFPQPTAGSILRLWRCLHSIHLRFDAAVFNIKKYTDRLFSSADCWASSNFCWAVPDLSSDFSRSSSICCTFLFMAATSASVEVRSFSFSSRSLLACSSLFLLSMRSSSTWVSFFWSSRTSSFTLNGSLVYIIVVNILFLNDTDLSKTQNLFYLEFYMNQYNVPGRFVNRGISDVCEKPCFFTGGYAKDMIPRKAEVQTNY